MYSSARQSIKSWTWYGTYPEACALVTGHSAGRDGDLDRDFTRWLVARYGGKPEVVYWHHVLRLALPNLEPIQAHDLTEEEHAVAVDKLFELLLAYLDDLDETS